MFKYTHAPGWLSGVFMMKTRRAAVCASCASDWASGRIGACGNCGLMYHDSNQCRHQRTPLPGESWIFKYTCIGCSAWD